MSMLLRLLKSGPRFRATLAKLGPENSLADALPAFSTNCPRHRPPPAETQPGDLDHKLWKISREISYHGRISKYNVDDIVKDIQESGSITSLQGLFLLRSCCEIMDNKGPKLRQKLGEEIWTMLKNFGVTLDVSHYNALLTIYLETECDFLVIEFLNEMVNSNIIPNRVTYQRLISRFCNQGKLIDAYQILEHVKNAKIPINEDMLCSFIYGHCVNNNSEAVAKVLEEMKSLDVTPTIKTYAAFMYAYAQKGDIENIRKTMKECESKDIWVPNKVLLTTIYHLSVHNFEKYADEILSLTSKSVGYVREANKIIYKLVEKQRDEIAFKIFQSLPKKTNDHGKFFIQTLINLNIPIEKSIEYCKILEEDNLNQRAFVLAIERSTANDMYESSITLMKAWKELGGQIMEHYFYPILKVYGQANDPNGVEKVLKTMILEFNIKLRSYTLATYVLPYVAKSPEEVMTSLINLPLDNTTISNAILFHLLSNNEIQKAVRYMNSNFSVYKQNFIRNSLLQAFKNTEDIPSFVWILHYLYVKALQENDTDNTSSIEFLDSCILEIIDFLAGNKYLNLMFFRNLQNKGLRISPEAAAEIVERLGDEASPKIVNIINKLKSKTLTPRPIQRANYLQAQIIKSMNVEKLESILLNEIDANSDAASCVKVKSLIYYCCTLNEEKVNKLLKDFEESGMNISNFIYSLLVNMYIDLGKIDKALDCLDEAKSKFSNFRINKNLNLKLMTALVENGEFEKAEKYIKPAMHTKAQGFILNKFLAALVKYNDEELLQRFFNQLNVHGYITEFKPHTLMPFVQLHLSRNDGKAAHRKSEWLYYNYGQTPYPVDLMRYLISSGDEETLKQVTTFYENIYDKSRCYFNLAIAYMENDNMDKARDVIRNNCSDISERSVLYYAETYYYNGQINRLEELFDILNDSKYDVQCLSLMLLKSYCFRNEWNKCYDLWVKMQEENIRTPETFFDFFNEILKNKNGESDEALDAFHTAVKNSDLATARQTMDSLSTVHKSECYSMLCHKYISSGIPFVEVLDLLRDLKKRFDLDVNQSTAEVVLGKMLVMNDLRGIEEIGTYLSGKLKKQLNYSYYLNKAHLISGSWNLYLKNLENKLNEGISNHEELDMDCKTAIYCLLQHPELCEQFEFLAYEYLQKNINSLMYVLWAYYFLVKNPKAEGIWLKHISDPKLFYEIKIINFLQYRKDFSLYVKLAKLIQKNNFNKNVKLSIFTNLIKSCMQSDDPEKYKYCLECLQHAILEIPMDQFSIDLLADLQKGLEQLGIVWPWSANLHKINLETSSS